jgi:mono/diheme cytochrome c family protein
MKSFLITLLAGIILCSTQGCYYDKSELLYPSSCDTLNITYTQTVKPVLNAYCLSCHGASVYNTLGGSVNLDGHTNLVVPVENGTLLKSIRHEAGASPMPKNQQKMPDCQITQIEKWILSGAPNN